LPKLKSKGKATHRAGVYDIYRHGVSVKYLSAFLHCRQEVQWIGEGWKPRFERFALSYGTFAHDVLRAIYTDYRGGKLKVAPNATTVRKYTEAAEERWKKEMGGRASAEALQQTELTMAMLEAVLPGYFEMWWDDFETMDILKVEEDFKVPWTLSDGKQTFLYGFLDLAFRYKSKHIHLLETKNKGRISPDIMHDTLPRDIQLLTYLYALWKETGEVPKSAWYNILRRPGLKQKKGESLAQLAKRIEADVKDRPEFYFMRLEIPCTKTDLLDWEAQLTGMIDDFYRWWKGEAPHYMNPKGCETQYGLCDYSQACAGNMRPYRLSPRKD
jgi:PD-(D/E)XK nuclease superfamily protein